MLELAPTPHKNTFMALWRLPDPAFAAQLHQGVAEVMQGHPLFGWEQTPQANLCVSIVPPPTFSYAVERRPSFATVQPHDLEMAIRHVVPRRGNTDADVGISRVALVRPELEQGPAVFYAYLGSTQLGRERQAIGDLLTRITDMRVVPPGARMELGTIPSVCSQLEAARAAEAALCQRLTGIAGTVGELNLFLGAPGA